MSGQDSHARARRSRFSLGNGVLVEAAGYLSESLARVAIAGLVGVLIARYLGPEGLGLFGYATSVFALLTPMALLGMRSVLVREFSTGDDWRAVLASASVPQVLVGVGASILGFIVVATTKSDQPQAMLIAAGLAPLPILAVGDSLRALLEARGKVRRIVAASLGSVVVGSVAKLIAILSGADIWVFAALTSFESVTLLALLYRGVGTRSISAAVSHFDAERAKSVVRESWPLLIAGLAVLLYMRADILMLGLLADDHVTGEYVAAVRISELWYFIPVAAMAAARPRLARLYAAGDNDAYAQATQRFMVVAYVLALGSIALTLAFGDPVIDLVYGSEFAGAAPVLRIHILAAPFVFLGVAAGQWFIDRGLTRAVMVRTSLGAALNIMLNIALIPAMGGSGAAIATLVSYGVAGVFFNGVRRQTRPVFRMQMRAAMFGLGSRRSRGRLDVPMSDADDASVSQENE